MSTADMVYEKTRRLPEELQKETLHYVAFLLAQGQARNEAAAWSKFSAGQLANQYVPEDSIYDEDERPA